MNLWHVTSKANIASIAESGLRSGTYFATNPNISDYYISDLEDDGLIPVILEVRLSDIDAQGLAPDLNGIEEPIATVLGKSEETIQEEWGASSKCARSSIMIIGSVRYMRPIPPALLFVVSDDQTTSLTEYSAHLIAAKNRVDQSVRSKLKPR